MRKTGIAGGLMLALLMVVTGGTAIADEDNPTQQEVEAAQNAVVEAADDVAGIQAQLAVANAELQTASVEAGQAAEAYNGARWRAQEARKAARKAERQAKQAAAEQTRHRDTYAGIVASTYQGAAPELAALTALTRSNGIEEAIQATATIRGTQVAMDQKYDEYRAMASLATVSADRATELRQQAEQAAEEARSARNAAQTAADAAAAQAGAIEAQKAALIAEVARLEGISVSLAERRQANLEAEAQAAAAAAAAQQQAELDAAQQPVDEPAQEPTEEPTQAPEPSEPAGDPTPPAEPATETPTETPTEAPTEEPAEEPTAPAAPPAAPSAPPAASSGARAAIAFARSQIGDPYRWAAAGPNAWDCSGLTMGAWAAGGKSLPHYSVAQYQQSTPISAKDLKPGDLVFWGSSSRSSSIYHVGLYVGDGQMIHAPRTGRPVVEESIHYWIPPTHYARP